MSTPAESPTPDTETPGLPKLEVVVRSLHEIVQWESTPVYGDDGKELYVRHRLVIRTGA